MDLGKLLIVSGALLLGAGVVVILLSRAHIPLGRLPGDVFYRGKHTTVYFPLATSLLVSVVISLAERLRSTLSRTGEWGNWGFPGLIKFWPHSPGTEASGDRCTQAYSR